MTDSFKAKSTLHVGNQTYTYYDLTKLEADFKVSRLPYSYKVLLENLLRHEDGVNITRDTVAALAGATLSKLPTQDIDVTPARLSMSRCRSWTNFIITGPGAAGSARPRRAARPWRSRPRRAPRRRSPAGNCCSTPTTPYSPLAGLRSTRR